MLNNVLLIIKIIHLKYKNFLKKQKNEQQNKYQMLYIKLLKMKNQIQIKKILQLKY